MGTKDKWGYSCQQCGQGYSKWMGRCQECGAWNSLVEELQSSSKNTHTGLLSSAIPKLIGDISYEEFPRLTTSISELDRALGGGLVPGSAVLIGGEPGIGKSTLLLQASFEYAKKNRKVLYASGEESPSQIALRAKRTGVESSSLWIVSETELERILVFIDEIKPDVLIIDSIQTLVSRELESQAGSVSQLRECAGKVIAIAKNRNLATFIVGHVTKEGSIAGPKILEHMVDTVLYFEGTCHNSFRLLRAIKNRFGSTSELGIFDISAKGLHSVENASELFLSERRTNISGSAVVASIEGTRPILVEVQALVSPSGLAIPRRTSIGIDHNRVSLLVAILEKRGGYLLYDQDVYVNVVSGIKLTEPAVDLGVIAALISSHTGKPLPKTAIFFGEVGLGGEVRSCGRVSERIHEASRVGLTTIYCPKSKKQEPTEKSVNIVGIDHIQALASAHE